MTAEEIKEVMDMLDPNTRAYKLLSEKYRSLKPTTMLDDLYATHGISISYDKGRNCVRVLAETEIGEDGESYSADEFRKLLSELEVIAEEADAHKDLPF